jgi:Ca2+-binding RTX toxin-like protein
VHVSTFINYLEFEYADNPQQTLNQLRQVKTALLKRGDVGKQTLAALEQAGDEDGNALAQMLARDVYLHLIGTDGNDILTSGSGFDVLEGGNGDDSALPSSSPACSNAAKVCLPTSPSFNSAILTCLS